MTPGQPTPPDPDGSSDCLPADERDDRLPSEGDGDPTPADDTTEEGPDHRRIAVRNDVKKRLDRYLFDRLSGISRNRIQKLIDLGGVTLNGQTPKASTVVRAGDVIDVILPPQAVRRIIPEDIPLQVIYEDDHCIVLNKQAGIIVHPGRANLTGTLLNALAWRFKQQVESVGGQYRDYQTSGFVKQTAEVASDEGAVPGLSGVGAQEFRPGIIHRLDRNTTGVIVLAKSDEAHWLIARQFEDRSTLKVYLAVAHGNLDSPGGAIEEPIGRHPTIKEAMAVRHDGQARHALTYFRVREQYRGYCLLELELKTGRTHQIRVHLSYLGHPIAGDIIYGGQPVGEAEIASPPRVAGGLRKFVAYARDKDDGIRMEQQAAQRPDMIMPYPALHAAHLRFTHPITRQPMAFTAPVHEPLRHLISRLRRQRVDAPVAKEGTWLDLDAVIGREQA